MDYIKVYWFGWYQSEKSDKVWGIIQIENDFYSFYGKRGTIDDLKKLKFTKLKNENQAISKRKSKEGKGYKESDPSIYTGFLEHLEEEMFYERLSGNV